MDSNSSTSKSKENKIDGRIPGSLAVLQLDDKELSYLLDYLAVTNPQLYPDFLYSLIGKDNLMMFLDVLEGLSVKVPSRASLIKIIGYIKIYSYVKARGFTEEAYEKAAKIFQKRAVALKHIVKKVEGIFNRLEDGND